jgi:hypothetical protein
MQMIRTLLALEIMIQVTAQKHLVESPGASADPFYGLALGLS